MTLFNETEELSRLSMNRTRSFLGKYFDVLEDKDNIDKEIVGRCRGMDLLEELVAEEDGLEH